MGNAFIGINKKKDFINYFLKRYQCKRRESVWILNYILSQEKILERVKFVDNVENCPFGIEMSSACVEDIPFKYYKGENRTTDAERAFHDIRLSVDTTIYIQLNFSNKFMLNEYIEVLEDNPYENENIPDEYIYEADYLIKKLTLEAEKEALMDKINTSLENGDKSEFINLSEQYNLLKLKMDRFISGMRNV